MLIERQMQMRALHEHTQTPYLYLVRHGETEYNKAKRYQGSIDIALSEKGREQARQAAKTIDTKFDVVVSSPLIRAKETAMILSGFSEEQIIIDDRIREISMGEYEGMYYDEVDDAFQTFFNEPEKYVSCRGSESFESLFARVDEFLISLIQKYKDTDAKILVVSHGAAIHGMLSEILKIERKDYWKYPVENCSVIKLGIEQKDGDIDLSWIKIIDN